MLTVSVPSERGFADAHHPPRVRGESAEHLAVVREELLGVDGFAGAALKAAPYVVNAAAEEC
jgi:hypothetical protein